MTETTSVITNLEEGLALLRSLDIIPEQAPENSSPLARLNTQGDWQMVSRKKNNKKQNT